RHAGAIEFMAPEQSAGQLFFQTDIYGFGVILFELLAGRVPYPLTDNSESARNMVMVAHMESQPPDLKELRRQHLPNNWSSEKQDREMHVPDWLLSMIYRCLRKKPEERFANGIELHNYIVSNSVAINRSQFSTTTNDGWQFQAEKLLKEKQQLQQQLAAKEAELQRLRTQPVAAGVGPERFPGQDDYQVNPKKNTAWIIAFVLTLLVASGLAYALINAEKKAPEEEKKPVVTNPLKTPDQLVEIGQYRVKAAKTHFHNAPDPSTNRVAFLSKNDPITAYDQEAGFIYTEFTNSRGQTSKGWLKLSELMTQEEWQQQRDTQPKRPTDAEIRAQLTIAADDVRSNNVDQALTIYNFLIPFNIPEAYYGAANLALQGKNMAIGCDEAITWLRRSSDAGHLPAKRTLGFLYMFAENQAVLSINGYTRCVFDKNFSRARLYLTQAANGGDTTAQQLLNQLNLNEQSNPPQ
ncbi:MAG TPA: protein kinase, partial [Chitinophagaceae bacterium]|nr:protein kinase [Chitinophagaceae bacterium]